VKTEEALRLIILLTQQANALGVAYRNARAEGRDDLTDAELQSAFIDKDDASRAKLQAQIDAIVP
jgi:hypothetical protein